MMMKAREFDDILDECLERILVGGETVEQCLASRPERAAELEPLLRTAVAAGRAAAIQPRPEFRERARNRFQAAVRDLEKKKAHNFFGWQPRWATAVIVALVVLISGSGTVAAAGSSMPDGPLYQVKLATEQVRLAFTPSDLGKAELYVKLADNRVAEIAKMAEKGKSKQVERAAHRLNGHLMAMAGLTAPSGPETAVFQAPVPRAAQQEAVVAEAPEKAEEKAAGPAMKEAPKAAMRKAQRGMPQAMPQRGGGGVEEEDITGMGQHARLRMMLSRHAMENPERLRAMLEQVPESVRPALLEAIALSDEAYRQALEALEQSAEE